MPEPFFATGPADMADSATILSMSGLDFMQRVANGTLPQAPIARILNFPRHRRLRGRGRVPRRAAFSIISTR